MAFLQIKNITKRFAETAAVDNLSLEVAQGELVSLLGPSGCGKTTTLQMIAGFVEPTAGEIVLAGRSLTRMPPQKRDIGVVFQSYALFPHMTVRENVAFGLQMRRVTSPDLGRRVDQALAQVQLDRFAGRYPRQLSGGQRQRVALARAMVIDPPLLLLDEPLSNLDAKLRDEMQVELRRVCRAAGLTAVLVTHDQAEALALSDRVAVLRDGRLEQVGTPTDIYDNPATSFVGGFIGKMNLWNAQLQRQGNGCSVQVASVVMGNVPSSTTAADTPVSVGLRPRAIRFGSGSQARLRGTVAARVYQGDQVLYVVATALGDVLVQAAAQAPSQPAEREQVGLCWRDDDLHLMRGERR